MKNRLKKKTVVTDDLLKDIKKTHEMILSNMDSTFTMSHNKDLPAWAINFQKIMLYEKHSKNIGEALSSSEDVTALIEALNALGEILNDPAPELDKGTKAYLIHGFTFRLICLWPNPDNPFIDELFNRRGEIQKDNPLRQKFLHKHIDEKVYTRFYEPKSKELRAKGEDLEDYYENQSPEEVERANKEWKEHFSELCREYNEKELINWEWDNSYYEDLPEDIKKDHEKALAAIFQKQDK